MLRLSLTKKLQAARTRAEHAHLPSARGTVGGATGGAELLLSALGTTLPDDADASAPWGGAAAPRAAHDATGFDRAPGEPSAHPYALGRELERRGDWRRVRRVQASDAARRPRRPRVLPLRRGAQPRRRRRCRRASACVRARDRRARARAARARGGRIRRSGRACGGDVRDAALREDLAWSHYHLGLLLGTLPAATGRSIAHLEAAARRLPRAQCGALRARGRPALATTRPPTPSLYALRSPLFGGSERERGERSVLPARSPLAKSHRLWWLRAALAAGAEARVERRRRRRRRRVGAAAAREPARRGQRRPTRARSSTRARRVRAASEAHARAEADAAARARRRAKRARRPNSTRPRASARRAGARARRGRRHRRAARARARGARGQVGAVRG